MAGRSGNQPSTQHPETANNWNFASLSEAASLLGVSVDRVVEMIKKDDVHLVENDLTNPVSESRAVTFSDGVKNTGKDAAEIERLVRNGDVRLRVPRSSPPGGG